MRRRNPSSDDSNNMDTGYIPLNDVGSKYSHIYEATDNLYRRGKIPYKSICLAVFLFAVGTVLLIVGSLLVGGVIIPPEYSDRTIPVLVLGLLTFIPGSYHTYMAWCAYRKYAGYSFDDIPSYDN